MPFASFRPLSSAAAAAFALPSRAVRVAVAAVALALAGGCATLPPPQGKVASTALPPAALADTPLAQALAPVLAAQPGLTGIVVLGEGSKDFVARLQLAAVAARSVDLQTYIFRADRAGLLMARELMKAAGRGVRVRVLVDDHQTRGLDPLLALMLDRGVQVRLFNPYASRDIRVPELLRDLKRLNSRMHAKSMIVDGRVAVMGGRNIGNEYADLAERVNFTDIDLLTVGAVLPRAAASFDRFWNSAPAYPAATVVDPARAWSMAEFDAALERAALAQNDAGLKAMTSRPVEDLLQRKLAFQWAPAALWTDDPDAPDAVEPDSPLDVPGRLVPRLRAALQRATTQLDLVSPYFVPDPQARQVLEAAARRGVKVRVLTNSLAATDVVAVHSGYARHRAALLAAGVALYELKPTALVQGQRTAFSINGSSSASLHAKAFAVDRRRLFVGSFNLDPRSARLNDELVLAVDSPVLAAQLADTLDRTLPQIAYAVTLGADGALRWTSGDEVLDREPQADGRRRAAAWVLSCFDLDWLL